MKAEIKASGVLVVSSETELEAYALRLWSEVNAGLIPESVIIKSSFLIDAAKIPPTELKGVVFK